MAKIFINHSELKRTFSRQQRPFKTALDNIVIPALQQEKQQLLDNIDSHPVSQEIRSEGELFGLIGFDKKNLEGFNQQDPVEDLINTVDKTTIIPTSSLSVTATSHDKISGKYVIRITDKEDLESNDKLRFPWGLHKNWVLAIERGISGLTHFLIGDRKSSRSGAGIQAKHPTGRTPYQPKSYFTDLINSFVTGINAIGSTVSRYNIRDLRGRFTKLFK